MEDDKCCSDGCNMEDDKCCSDGCNKKAINEFKIKTTSGVVGIAKFCEAHTALMKHYIDQNNA